MKSDLIEFEIRTRDKKIICYGAGVNGILMLEREDFAPFLQRICCFVDRDEKRAGTSLSVKGREYPIFGLDKLDEASEDYVVLITIADYVMTGRMLKEKGIEWYAWTVISSDTDFSFLDPVKNNKKSFLLNVPDYMNLGDHAITIAEREYLKKTVGEFYEIGSDACHPGGLSALKEYVTPEDTIFIQGGGNMGSLWRVFEENIRNIVKTFPDNKIVIFPQSVFYGDSDEEQGYFKESVDIYNSHKNLLICSRDKRSYEFVNEAYTCKSLLVPDMVLTYKAESTTHKKRSGVGLLLRDDKERYIDREYENTIREAVRDFDKSIRVITHHPVAKPDEREKMISELLDIYSSCELVITDRLHGMIISAITNTPCIAFDNSYHKIFDLYKTWLSDNDGISITGPVKKDELEKIITDIISKEVSIFDSQYYQSKFAEVTDFIKE